ncbi:RDD family protein [Mycolicibacterium sp. P9-64]|uniref:RDD family protein n=1 Tax=Mycolicibacterium sp. P9-64 TaxID=2024612 RepID=UPI0011EF72A9|nr:RDD family protein [Mycolicibacterium sp. P9-64]KAA0085680.1 RDD family protein [Mycolicibacterium sp. P9-64]
MVAQPEPLVTGDAVVLDVQIAQLPIRAVSAFIDLTVVFVAYVLGVVLWALTLSDLDTAASAAILILFTVLATVGYPVIFETATRGRSLGKIATGLRVVSDDGGPERFRQALFRALSGFVEFWMLAGGPAVICSMVSAKGKRVGDVFAGTMVISERGPKLSPPPLMPPSLAWWASSLQLSGLAAESAERARQFLSRAPQLDPGMRDQIAYRVCSEVVAQISPPPPPGTPPQLVLAAVLAERHRRELARLQRPFPVASLAPRPFPVASLAPRPFPVAPLPPRPATAAPPPQWGPQPGPGYQPPMSPPAATDPGGFTPPS